MTYADLDFSLSYTYADYLKWTFEERLELIKGKLFKLSAPNRWHQKLSGEIFWRLYSFLRGKPCEEPCEVYAAPFDVRLPRKSKRNRDIFTVVQPDLCVICDQSKLDRKGCLGSPDIVVEILSPGNYRRELLDKYKVYQESGVKEYWVFMYNEQICIQYMNNFEGRFSTMRPLGLFDTLNTPVLPGFELHLTDVFGKLSAAA
jgi:Uma2 family endonuclease